MKITTVRLNNFKSFGPKPTKINLAELTYILGPNGLARRPYLKRCPGCSALSRVSAR